MHVYQNKNKHTHTHGSPQVTQVRAGKDHVTTTKAGGAGDERWMEGRGVALRRHTCLHNGQTYPQLLNRNSQIVHIVGKPHKLLLHGRQGLAAIAALSCQLEHTHAHARTRTPTNHIHRGANPTSLPTT